MLKMLSSIYSVLDLDLFPLDLLEVSHEVLQLFREDEWLTITLEAQFELWVVQPVAKVYMEELSMLLL